MTATVTSRRMLSDVLHDCHGRVVCLALSKDPNAKMTILLFPPGEEQPKNAAKVPTTSVAAGRVRHEAIVLASIDRERLGPISRTVPEVAEVVEHMGWPVLVTTALPGRLMLASYHQWRYTARPLSVKSDFDAAGRWLAVFQGAMATGDTELARMTDGLAADLVRQFGDNVITNKDIDIVLALHDRLDRHSVGRGLVHGDFWPGNLLMNDCQVSGVIDWESASPDGLLTRDLARFAIAYSLYLDRHTRSGRRVPGHAGLRAGTWGAGLEYALNGTGWYPELVHRFMAEGLQRLGVDPSCAGDVILAEIACIAAEADNPEFAKSHLRLLRRLTGSDAP
ncbi:MAG TPA: aminoglycoside phosphotransferase family protein [Acidimicrobiales bacterium]